MSIGYKVVAVRNGERGSIFLEPNSIGYIRYRKGKWVTARPRLREKGYYPLIFSNLRTAANFIMEWGEKCELWQVKYIGVAELPSSLSLNHLKNLNQICRIPTIDISESYPEGSLMVKKVKLIKRLARMNDWWESRNIFQILDGTYNKKNKKTIDIRRKKNVGVNTRRTNK
jgi:hypothetical protein